jgi:hypothetical protein
MKGLLHLPIQVGMVCGGGTFLPIHVGMDSKLVAIRRNIIRVFSCRLRCRRCNRLIISQKIGRYQKCKDFIGNLDSCVWTGPADPACQLTDRRRRWIQVQALLLLRSTECLPR